MKKGVIIVLFLVLFLGQFVVADIIFSQPVNAVYNLGESILLPVTVKSLNDFSGTLQMSLICNGTNINFFSYPLTLVSGEEVSFQSPKPSLVLIKNIIGTEEGICRIRAVLGNEYALTSEFKISDFLNVEANLAKTEFNPGETVVIKGKVTREAGAASSGFIEARIISSTNNISQQSTVTNGNFELNFVLPSNIKAENYVIQLNVSEKDSNGSVTNHGMIEKAISVNQVATNLELILDNSSVLPGSWFGFRAVLHDQTGESISSLVVATIKDSSNKIIEQKEIQTEEYFEYFVKPNQAPAKWHIFAVSNKLSAEGVFEIDSKKSIDIEIVNKTILITNDGNVPYNDTILVKVGDNPVNLEVRLNVGESKKYVVNAPNGDYDLTVMNGLSELIKKVSLTGRTIEIKEAGVGSLAILGWCALVIVLAVSFIFIFRRVYQKPFFMKAFLGRNSKKKDFKEISVENNTAVSSNSGKAEMSLSIKGDKQDASIICVKIKNLSENKSRKGSPSETIEKITSLAEENKATVYENQDYLFFIFAPVRTRTFKNEKTALDVADKIQGILSDHNRSFNQKMEFGISLNSGAIIAKSERDSFKFMSMGTLITVAKKIASLSNGEVLLSREMNDLLRLTAKTEKVIRNGTPVYIITRIKRENEEARKFIDKFMHRQNKNN